MRQVVTVMVVRMILLLLLLMMNNRGQVYVWSGNEGNTRASLVVFV